MAAIQLLDYCRGKGRSRAHAWLLVEIFVGIDEPSQGSYQHESWSVGIRGLRSSHSIVLSVHRLTHRLQHAVLKGKIVKR
jgi:hypothetical protein